MAEDSESGFSWVLVITRTKFRLLTQSWEISVLSSMFCSVHVLKGIGCFTTLIYLGRFTDGQSILPAKTGCFFCCLQLFNMTHVQFQKTSASALALSNKTGISQESLMHLPHLGHSSTSRNELCMAETKIKSFCEYLFTLCLGGGTPSVFDKIKTITSSFS